jgi:hypothetical protein
LEENLHKFLIERQTSQHEMVYAVLCALAPQTMSSVCKQQLIFQQLIFNWKLLIGKIHQKNIKKEQNNFAVYNDI